MSKKSKFLELPNRTIIRRKAILKICLIKGDGDRFGVEVRDMEGSFSNSFFDTVEERDSALNTLRKELNLK